MTKLNKHSRPTRQSLSPSHLSYLHLAALPLHFRSVWNLFGIWCTLRNINQLKFIQIKSISSSSQYPGCVCKSAKDAVCRCFYRLLRHQRWYLFLSFYVLFFSLAKLCQLMVLFFFGFLSFFLFAAALAHHIFFYSWQTSLLYHFCDLIWFFSLLALNNQQSDIISTSK